jgi:hypothetical protein
MKLRLAMEETFADQPFISFWQGLFKLNQCNLGTNCRSITTNISLGYNYSKKKLSTIKNILAFSLLKTLLQSTLMPFFDHLSKGFVLNFTFHPGFQI